jgi:formylmethanofuran dehydrogenase subunit E
MFNVTAKEIFKEVKKTIPAKKTKWIDCLCCGEMIETRFIYDNEILCDSCEKLECSGSH